MLTTICLATCESAKTDSPQGFLGIAPKIVQKGVPAVVAMRYQVLVSTAEIFLEEFYNAITERKPVDWAVQWARNQVSSDAGLDNREFATPVLFMRADDGNIF
ncbi:CHAT domain-containing protein [Desulfonema magnum]|uniref:CHAT domain-containing protein n=1 Tax=Desulfonema magnum TaxID=45655 RepID=A0A975BH58_9BACT|nr:CHAT domain-containing protein [Desulfonema magnum]QTA85337.1 CHAT domain-containing protein [Desulfonema magnum]